MTHLGLRPSDFLSGGSRETLHCPMHGRWIVWQGCGCEQHSRPCPECPRPRREYHTSTCILVQPLSLNPKAPEVSADRVKVKGA